MTKKKVVEAVEDEVVKPISTLWVFFALGVLGVGLFAFFLLTASPASSSFELNGFTFEQAACPSVEGRCWQTTVVSNVGVHPITFYSDPREVDWIPVSREAVLAVLNLTYSSQNSLTIAFDEGVPGEVGVAASLLARVTGERLYNIPTRGAVYGEGTHCSLSTSRDRVVYLTQGERDAVFVRDGCVIVSARSTSSLISVVDAYVMHLLLIL
ncbi:MAG: hypothetical protein ACMXYD_02530 [Candidatus Woesearchaeota archaeon]